MSTQESEGGEDNYEILRNALKSRVPLCYAKFY